jgi:hypothetical protein
MGTNDVEVLFQNQVLGDTWVPMCQACIHARQRANRMNRL